MVRTTLFVSYRTVVQSSKKKSVYVVIVDLFSGSVIRSWSSVLKLNCSVSGIIPFCLKKLFLDFPQYQNAIWILAEKSLKTHISPLFYNQFYSAIRTVSDCVFSNSSFKFSGVDVDFNKTECVFTIYHLWYRPRRVRGLFRFKLEDLNSIQLQSGIALVICSQLLKKKKYVWIFNDKGFSKLPSGFNNIIKVFNL